MNAYHLLLFNSADPFLSRVDKSSLSQQTLMELLINGFLHKENICGDTTQIKSISKWERVEFDDDSDNDSDVVTLLWDALSLGGWIELKWLPETAQYVFLMSNDLTGTVDLTCLPGSLVSLNIGNNRFEGMVDLTQLPDGLEDLSLQENGFFGQTDFSELPALLNMLDVSDTKLEGEIFEFDGELETEGSQVEDMRDI